MDTFRQYANIYDNGKGGGSFEPDPGAQAITSVALIHTALRDELAKFRSFSDELNRLFTQRGARGVDLEAGYLIDDRMKAEASSFKGKDIVAVYLGLAVFLKTLFDCFARDGIYSAALTTGMFPLKPEGSPISFPLNLEAELLGHHQIKPRLDERDQVISRKLFGIALQWIFHHELAHIWNGHTGLPSGESQNRRFVDGADEQVENDLRSIALEMDADSRASHVLMMMHLGLAGTPDRSGAVPTIMFKESNWSLEVLWIVLAIDAALHSLQSLIWKCSSSLARRTHPAPAVRALWNSNAIRNTFRGVPGAPMHEIERVIGLAGAAVFSGLICALGEQRTTTEVESGRDWSELRLVWNELYPALDEAKRGFAIPSKYENGQQKWILDESYPL